MPAHARIDLHELENLVSEVHADDVKRARDLIDGAVAAAATLWIPRNAVFEALVGALDDLARSPGGAISDFGRSGATDH